MIFQMTLCNIRMLQSVNHILTSRFSSIHQILLVVVLLDQAPQIHSFDTSFVEFDPESMFLETF